jgi:hypothetical protein
MACAPALIKVKALSAYRLGVRERSGARKPIHAVATIGGAAGFMHVCDGEPAPLRRIQRCDSDY